MKRSDFIRTLLAASAAPFLPQNLFAKMQDEPLSKAQFGKDFLWGLSASAYQTEGAWNIDGKSPSIWDVFAHTKGKIKTGENGDVACDFYHRYPEDIAMMKQLNFQVNRFSLAWSRLKPDGIGRINPLGVDFYNRVIDRSLEVGVQPWITMFHWDLPWTLYERGGWQNRDVIDWFSEYTYDASRLFGDRVKNWMILNEPMAFTALGHVLGMHAPGKKNPLAFLAASHHAAMVQAEAGRIVRQNVKEANIGTNFSCQHVEAIDDKEKNQKAAIKADALLNRMFVEPSLGLGYPVKDAPIIRWIEKYMKDGDEQKLKFDFDFIGIQNYTRIVMKAALNPLGMKEVTPQERGVPYTEMNWEVYPEGIYHLLKKFAAYPQVKKIIVTENGAAFPDTVQHDGVHDAERVAFFQAYLKQVLRAKQEGINVGGYFVWTMMDNFEWAEGYRPRFGLVHVDFETQKRTIKDSGLWFKEFLKD